MPPIGPGVLLSEVFEPARTRIISQLPAHSLSAEELLEFTNRTLNEQVLNNFVGSPATPAMQEAIKQRSLAAVAAVNSELEQSGERLRVHVSEAKMVGDEMKLSLQITGVQLPNYVSTKFTVPSDQNPSFEPEEVKVVTCSRNLIRPDAPWRIE